MSELDELPDKASRLLGTQRTYKEGMLFKRQRGLHGNQKKLKFQERFCRLTSHSLDYYDPHPRKRVRERACVCDSLPFSDAVKCVQQSDGSLRRVTNELLIARRGDSCAESYNYKLTPKTALQIACSATRFPMAFAVGVCTQYIGDMATLALPDRC